MKSLFLDPSDEELFLAFQDKDKLFVNECVSSKGKLDYQKDFFITIKKSLEQNHIQLENIERIVFINGPGAYSSLRIAAMFVKTISLIYNLPIYVMEKSLLLLAHLLPHQDKQQTYLYIIHSSYNHYFLYLYHNNKVLKQLLLNLQEVIDLLDQEKWTTIKKFYFTLLEVSLLEKTIQKQNTQNIVLLGFSNKELFLNGRGLFSFEPRNLTDIKKQNLLAMKPEHFFHKNYLVHPVKLSPLYINRIRNTLLL